MPNIAGSILRAVTRRPDEPLNILAVPTHERFSQCWGLLPHNFYLYRGPRLKDWNFDYAPLPANTTLLSPGNIPPDLDLDLIVSQSKAGQYQVLRPMADANHLPLISLEHTLPHPGWDPMIVGSHRKLRGDVNVFLSDYSVRAWGWGEDAVIVPPGIDDATFTPDWTVETQPVVLSVVNDWKNRDWCMPAGEKIYTRHGFVPIEQVRLGMEVLTDDGCYHPIVRTMTRDYFGDLVVVSLNRDTQIRFTVDHNIRVYRNSQWMYVAASRLREGDEMKYPEHVQTDFSYDHVDRAWLIGLIAGDGHLSNMGGIQITMHEDELETLQRAKRILDEWGCHASISDRLRSRGKRAYTLETQYLQLSRWLRGHIGNKHDKRIPDFIVNGSTNIRLSALQGAWAADGHLSQRKCPTAAYVSISPRLAGQVHALLHSFGIKATLRRHRRSGSKANGQSLMQYRVQAYGKENVENLRCLLMHDPRQQWQMMPVSYVIEGVSFDREWSGTVYNCEVKDEPSYVVWPGFVAHNCCGFDLWRRLTQGLPVAVLGDNPGLSKPAGSIAELVMNYRTARVFLNTSLASTCPFTLLESMACGQAVVSTATTTIPNVIEDGVNGFCSNDERVLRRRLEQLLADEPLCRRLGRAARQTIEDKFSFRRMAADWDGVFRAAATIIPHAGGQP